MQNWIVLPYGQRYTSSSWRQKIQYCAINSADCRERSKVWKHKWRGLKLWRRNEAGGKGQWRFVGLEGDKRSRVQRGNDVRTGEVSPIFLRMMVAKGMSGINRDLKICGSGMEWSYILISLTEEQASHLPATAFSTSIPLGPSSHTIASVLPNHCSSSFSRCYYFSKEERATILLLLQRWDDLGEKQALVSGQKSRSEWLLLLLVWDDEDSCRACIPPPHTEVSAAQTPVSLLVMVEDYADGTEEKGFSGSMCWSQRWSLSFVEMDKASSLPWLGLSMKPAEDVLFINIEQEGRQQFWNPSTIVTDKTWEGIKKKKITVGKWHILEKKVI